MMFCLRRQVQCLADRRTALAVVDEEYQDAAHMAVEAAEMDVRATIIAARSARRIPTISPEEAARLRAVIVTGGVVA